MKKVLLSTLLMVLVSAVSAGQSSGLGVFYYRTGELDVAKQLFEREMASNPAESNYYLGEIAFANGDEEQAKSYYDKALAADANYSLARVGVGKYLLKKGDVKAAEAEFSQVEKKEKKNVEVLVAIAEAYFYTGHEAKVAERIEKAKKADKKSPIPYLAEGDFAYVKSAKTEAGSSEMSALMGEAAKHYDMANYYDDQNVLAYLKSAQVYEVINPEMAMEKLNKALELNPNLTLINRDFGRYYFSRGQYAKAIESYKLFFPSNLYSMNDVVRFAGAYYFLKQMDEASQLLDGNLAKEPNNFVLNRLKLYVLNDTKQYDKALPVAEKLFSLKEDKVKKIARDYLVYGEVLLKNGQIDKALEQYSAAVALDPKEVNVYKDIATAVADEKRYATAAEYYGKYVAGLPAEKVAATDLFTLGRYNYLAASSAEGEQKTNLLTKADSAFAQVIEKRPDAPIGHVWRARANSLLDPETDKGLAKPYYEKAIEVILARDANSTSSDLKEAYGYLAVYYYKADDKANTLKYANLLLAIDPANETAKQLLAALK